MTREFTREIVIHARPETVYGFLTKQEKAALWFGEVTQIDGRPGGVFKVGSSGGMTVRGEFLETVPFEKVVFTWGGVEGLADGESTVAINLYAVEAGTRLVLHHYGIASTKAADSFAHGWPHYAFPLLKLVAEGGTTKERCFRSRP